MRSRRRAKNSDHAKARRSTSASSKTFSACHERSQFLYWSGWMRTGRRSGLGTRGESSRNLQPRRVDILSLDANDFAIDGEFLSIERNLGVIAHRKSAHAEQRVVFFFHHRRVAGDHHRKELRRNERMFRDGELAKVAAGADRDLSGIRGDVDRQRERVVAILRKRRDRLGAIRL